MSLIYNVPVASPFRGDGLQDLLVWIVLGFPVLLQRAAIGFAVAAIFRSQLAGAVVGIVLFLVEAVVTTILTVLTLRLAALETAASTAARCVQPVGPEWFQFLPISVGGNVFNALPGAGGLSSGDISAVFLQARPVRRSPWPSFSSTSSLRWLSRSSPCAARRSLD